MSSPVNTAKPIEVDTLIVGGGIAGLWLLDRLRNAGYRAILFERDALGVGQTLASQGMVHGGLKYALGGKLTGATDAIADMPNRWRACLAGTGEVDLRGLKLLADRYCLFAGSGTLGKLTSFFASRSLRGRIEQLAPDNYPVGFQHPEFRGVVYGLNDFVLHTPSLIRLLQQRHAQHIFQAEVRAEDCQVLESTVQLRVGHQSVTAQRLILTAGAGTGSLLQGMGIAEPSMQLRPLHQVVVRGQNLPKLFAHCLTGIRSPEPRLTITSHESTSGEVLWYLGGSLATKGVGRTDAQQQAFARDELRTCVPWLDWSQVDIESLHIDRAEPKQTSGLKPDSAFVTRRGPVMVAWPTKLSLVPDLGEQTFAQLQLPVHNTESAKLDENAGVALQLPRAECALEPWLTHSSTLNSP